VKDISRFPVFVRHIHDHHGPKTQLLKTHRDVTRALYALRLRGYRLRDLMIVEFCDTADRDGLFRKFSAFKVGEHIIPLHLLASHHWCVKSVRNEATEDRVRESLRYSDENPHREWLDRMFKIAGVEYGRADYGMLNGVPQLWEINLNPTFGRGVGRVRDSRLSDDVRNLREEGRTAFHARLRAAFIALDSRGGNQEVTATIDGTLVARVQAETAAARRRARVLGRLFALRDHPQFGLPVRAALKMFPRY
jgi:hypothetical protein